MNTNIHENSQNKINEIENSVNEANLSQAQSSDPNIPKENENKPKMKENQEPQQSLENQIPSEMTKDYIDQIYMDKFINPDYYDEFGRPKYEEIINFQNEIVKEIEDTSPLVSEKMTINYLTTEFKDSMFVNSVFEIVNRYKHIRTVRRDGNCFYRSFMFRLFEELSLKKQYKLYNNIVKTIEDSKDLIIRNGTQWFVLEDFYNMFLSEWKFVYQLDPSNTEEYM